jgi:hypothetical protein
MKGIDNSIFTTSRAGNASSISLSNRVGTWVGSISQTDGEDSFFSAAIAASVATAKSVTIGASCYRRRLQRGLIFGVFSVPPKSRNF